jgi:hypothetical protein
MMRRAIVVDKKNNPFKTDGDRRQALVAMRKHRASESKESEVVVSDYGFCGPRDSGCIGPSCGTWNRVYNRCALGVGTELEALLVSHFIGEVLEDPEEEPGEEKED